jgi:hypothetical protein
MSEISEVVERMRELREQLASLADVGLHGASDEDLCALTVATEEAGRLLDSLRVAEAGELADRSAPGLGHDSLAVRLGQGKAVMLVAFLTRVSNAEAARRMKLGTATRHRATIDGTVLEPFHPAVRRALTSGDIGVESATRIVRAMDDASRTATDEEIACAETELVGAAATDTADEIGVQATLWREFLDPDGAEPREERAHRKRAFRFGRERDGLVPFSGEMELVPAALLKAAFEEAFAATKPRFLTEADGGVYDPDGGTDAETAAGADAAAGGEIFASLEIDRTVSDDDAGGIMLDGLEIDPDAHSDPVTDLDPDIHPDGTTLDALVAEVAKDPRTLVQRQHDVFTGLITAGLRSTDTSPGSMRPTAQVTAVISLQDLKDGKGVGVVEGIDDPLSATAIRRIVEENGYATVVEGDNGEILFLTKHRRLFTAQQIRGLLVRDGGCVWPGCGARAGSCEGHHVIPYSEGGPTHIDNAVLLCPFHHAMLPGSHFQMRMIRGKPHLLAPPWIDPDQRWIPLGKSRIAKLNALRLDALRLDALRKAG